MKRAGVGLLALLWSTPAMAQGSDAGGMAWAFVQSGPAGCPAAGASDAPGFDPNLFAGCWLPPSLCPPLEAVAAGGTTIVLPFDRIQPGAPCLLLVSPVLAMPLIAPCHWAGHDVLGIVPGDAGGRASFRVALPAVRLPLTGGIAVGQAQLVVLDTNSTSALPVLATSQVLRVEARF